MAALSLRGLTKRYGEVEAVSDVTLDVADGEFLVLLGASGSGKSTILKLIAGIEQPDSGEIWLDDARVDVLLPGSRDLAMVFQSYALYPHMTVAGNLGFPLRSQGVARAEARRRVEEVAGLLGIGELLRRRPAQLSGGQQQRVALGRAIIRLPKTYLMDEPLSNLDAKLHTKTRLELVRVHERLGVTTVYVTHDQVEAMTMGHRIAVIDGGVLHQIDPPEVIYEHPANLVVADFLGSPPMNLLHVRCTVLADRVVVNVEEVELVLPSHQLEGSVLDALRHVGPSGVVLGVRPEYLRPTDKEDGPSILAIVERVELLGSERVVHLRMGQSLLAARVPVAVRPVPGERVRLALDVAGVRFFDAATGRRLADVGTGPAQCGPAHSDLARGRLSFPSP